MEPIVVSVEEAKRLLGGLSTATIYRMLDAGTLERRRVGGRALISMASIRRAAGEVVDNEKEHGTNAPE